MSEIWKSREEMERLFPRVKFIGPPGGVWEGPDHDTMVFDEPCPLTVSTIRLAYAWLNLHRRLIR